MAHNDERRATCVLSYWVQAVRPGYILFELDGCNEARVSHSFPEKWCSCRIWYGVCIHIICKMYVCWKLTTQLKQYLLNPANELTLAETNTWFWMIAFFSMNVHLGGICQLCWFYHLRIKSSTGGTLISHCQFPYDILDCSSDRSTPTAW